MEWKERIRDPKVECMSRDEMTALQSERLVKLVERVYKNVPFYHEKMKALGVEPEISKEWKISINFHLQRKRI